MKNIDPSYVGLDSANLLKGVGFIFPPISVFIDKCFIEDVGYEYSNNMNVEGYVSAPEHWLVIDWLMIEHDIFISVGVQIGAHREIFDYTIYSVEMGLESKIASGEGFLTPYLATEDAIRYVLTHLI